MEEGRTRKGRVGRENWNEKEKERGRIEGRDGKEGDRERWESKGRGNGGNGEREKGEGGKWVKKRRGGT